MTQLSYTAKVARETEAIYQRLSQVVTRAEWEVCGPLVARINELKRERGAIVLAHNYMTPEIFHGVADLRGDSLSMARQAAENHSGRSISRVLSFL